jgi:hypothetical protein
MREKAVASVRILWDYPTMSISTADKKKRVVIPAAHPGDVFDVHPQGEGQVVLVRLIRPQPKARMSRGECLRAMAAAPLRPEIEWNQLRKLTRDP